MPSALRSARRAASGEKAVVELLAPTSTNLLHRAFLALECLGVDIVYAHVLRGTGGDLVRLQLLRSDGEALGKRRLADVLDALRNVVSSPDPLAVSRVPPVWLATPPAPPEVSSGVATGAAVDLFCQGLGGHFGQPSAATR